MITLRQKKDTELTNCVKNYFVTYTVYYSSKIRVFSFTRTILQLIRYEGLFGMSTGEDVKTEGWKLKA